MSDCNLKPTELGSVGINIEYKCKKGISYTSIIIGKIIGRRFVFS